MKKYKVSCVYASKTTPDSPWAVHKFSEYYDSFAEASEVYFKFLYQDDPLITDVKSLGIYEDGKNISKKARAGRT